MSLELFYHTFLSFLLIYPMLREILELVSGHRLLGSAQISSSNSHVVSFVLNLTYYNSDSSLEQI